METVGLIAAMRQESQALLRCVGASQALRIADLNAWRFELGGRDCTLIESGIGIERAAQAARQLISAADPQLLLMFGIAGALQPDLQVGDAVAGRSSCLLEKGLTGSFRPLAALSEQAWSAMALALESRGARLLHGTVITTRGSQALQTGPRALEHPVLEMETSGVAQVADEHGIALLALRAISDGPQAPLPFDLEAITDENYRLRTGELVKALVRHPRIILQTRSMARNLKTAADHAALAVAAALGQPAPLLTRR